MSKPFSGYIKDVSKVPIAKCELDDGYSNVRDLFLQLLKDGGSQVGHQLTVYINGKRSIHLVGGYKDPTKLIPLSEDSLFKIYSNSKNCSALVTMMLVDRGILAYDTPIVKIWPEFSGHGKEKLILSDILRHESGISFLPRKLKKVEDVADLKLLAPLFEARKPVWESKSKRHYHSSTRGMLLNQIISRADEKGRTVGMFMEDEVIPSLKMKQNLVVGRIRSQRDEEFLKRLCFHVEPNSSYRIWNEFAPAFNLFKKPTTESKMIRNLLKSAKARATYLNHFPGKMMEINDVDILEYENPSSCGVSNSDTMARLGYVIANGGKDDDEEVNLFPNLGEKITQLAISEPIRRFDNFFQHETNFTLGGFDHFDVVAPDFYGWNGYGGSCQYFSPKHKVGFAYCPVGMLLAGHWRKGSKLCAVKLLEAFYKSFIQNNKKESED